MNRHSKSLQHALQVLRQDKYAKYINAIYLYGSCARGTQKYDSDIDLLLMVQADTPKAILRQMQIEVMPEEIDLPPVELKISMGDTFSDSSQFNENIKRDGRLLWERT